MTMTLAEPGSLEHEIRRRLLAGEPTLFRELAVDFGFGERTVQNRIQRVKAQLEAEEAVVVPEIIGQEVVAETLNISSQAISNWYSREAESERDWEMPEPILVQYKTGKKPTKVWRRAQLKDWRIWHERHLAEQGDHIPAKQRKPME